MEIRRIDAYDDERFTRTVLDQHGCFLVDGEPCEVEILSDHEAVIRGVKPEYYPTVIEEFRFYTPHITKFYDACGCVVGEFPPVLLMKVPLEEIQPSQFYVDQDKLSAISRFIRSAEDIIVPVISHQGRYLSLDGHTRLYYAALMGWDWVRAVMDDSDDWIYKFAAEAQKRNINTPKDLIPVDHREYEEKWNRFCDEFFARAAAHPPREEENNTH